MSSVVKVGRIKPAGESGNGSFVVMDLRDLPGGIPITALDHGGLPEDAFK